MNLEIKFESEKARYENDPQAYLSPIEDVLGRKIVDVEFIDEFGEFIILAENFVYRPNSLYRGSPKFLMNSLIETYDGYMLRVQMAFDFYLPDGSFLRVSPYHNSKVEITRMEVSLPGVGLGSLLFELFCAYVEGMLGHVPAIVVHITGSIGFQSTYKEYPIQKQKRFFLKHGFKVKDEDPFNVWLERPDFDRLSPFLYSDSPPSGDLPF